MKRKSRATRLDDFMSSMHDVVIALFDIASRIEASKAEGKTVEFDVVVAEAKTELEKVDVGDVQELYDEIESWKSNLEGTNLEHSQKYSDLEECCDSLQSLISEIECVDVKVGATSVEQLEVELREKAAELDLIVEGSCVCFPGMY